MLKNNLESIFPENLRYKYLIDLTPDVIYALDAKGRFIWVNNNFQKVTGWKSKDYIGKSFQGLIHPEDLPLAFKNFQLTLSGETLKPFELRIRSKKGGFLVGKFYGVPLIKDGQVVGKLGLGQDITEIKLREKNLHDNIKQLQELYSLSIAVSKIGGDLNSLYNIALGSIQRLLNVEKAAILLIDSKGVMQFKAVGLSTKYRQLLEGYSPWTKNTEQPQPIAIPDVSKSKLTPNMKKIMIDGDIKSLAFFPLTTEKRIIGRFMVYYPTAHKFSGQEVNLAQIVGKHISLSFSRMKDFGAIMDSIADGVTIQDASGKLIFANLVAVQNAGYESAEEMVKDPTKWQGQFELKDEHNQPFDIERLPGRRALRGEKNPQELIKFIDAKTGQVKWSLVKARPILNEIGKTYLVVNIVHDVTDSLELERRKDEFISTASHELKTPIATLKGFTQIMKTSSDPQKNRYYLDKMEVQIDRLCQLVEDLLDVAKIQSDKLSIQKRTFGISKLIQEIAEDFHYASSGHQIEIVNGINQTVKADRYRLSEVLNNLISNAVKFSPKSSKVLVKLKKKDNKVIVSVQDFGIGISKKNLSRVFEPFFQANNKIRQSFSGLGLGLHISAEIIKRHGGEIWVESEKGKGTTFSFSLPLKA